MHGTIGDINANESMQLWDNNHHDMVQSWNQSLPRVNYFPRTACPLGSEAETLPAHTHQPLYSINSRNNNRPQANIKSHQKLKLTLALIGTVSRRRTPRLLVVSRATVVARLAAGVVLTLALPSKRETVLCLGFGSECRGFWGWFFFCCFSFAGYI